MAPKTQAPPVSSSFGLKYPTARDSVLKSADIWLNGKREDDGADGLWRIHNCLYDFTDFVKDHPGGSDWLRLTKGTDITEAFEVHHISTKPESLLKRYYVSTTTKPRNSPFTFHKDGFYNTLKAKVRPVLETLPKTSITLSKLYIDAIMIATFIFSVMAVRNQSYIFGLLAGYSLCALAIAAHNFSHQRDNFRMYYFDLTPMQTKDWRVVHILSHHMYTNTLTDLEISMYEPWFNWIPDPKRSFIQRYSSWLSAPYTFCNIYFFSFLCRAYYVLWIGGEEHKPKWTDLLPYVLPTTMYMMSNATFGNLVFWWMFVLISSSFLFGWIGANAAHHHPDLFHDGDAPRSEEDRDWGIMQLDSVMDRKDVTGNHFLVLTTYGDHGLHHMFPTLDHGQLDLLYPIFEETCKEFGVALKMNTQLGMIAGAFKQLARNKPNEVSPTMKKLK